MDMANQREMLNAINAINKENLTTGRSRYTTSGNLFGEDQKSTAAANQQRGQNLSQMRGQDITASTAEANRRTQERGQDIQREVAQIKARSNAAGRPFNVIQTQFDLLKTGDPKKDAALLQRIVSDNAEAKKPGLNIELLKKFEALPGVKTDLETLSALRMIGTPKPETVTRIKQIEDRLANKARQNGIDPATVGVTADALAPVGGAAGKVPPPPPGFTPDKP
jgi:chorismate mutase